MSQDYLTQCWNCLGEFDAVSAIWCSCNPRSPTKVCPFCLNCFCSATPEFKQQFWNAAPDELKEDLSTLGRSKLPIGELLIRANQLTTSQLLAALKEQKRRGGQTRIGEILVDLGFVSRENIDYFLRHQQSVATFDLQKVAPRRDLIDKIGLDLCLRKKILPLEWEVFRDRPMLTLAMASPGDAGTIDQVQSLTQAQVIPGLAPEEEILRHLRAAAASGESPAPAPAPAAAEEAPAEDAVGFVQKLLANALRQGASDVHIEIGAEGFVGRYRIDGVQYKVPSPPRRQAEAIGHALYDLFKIRPKKRGVPVEARAATRAGEAAATLFVRALQTAEKEDFQIKVISEKEYVLPLEQTGLDAAALQSLEEALRNDNGLFVVSAPPFHGVRSLLYSLQRRLAASGRSCTSLESPCLLKVPGVEQVECGGEGALLPKALEQVRSKLPQVLVLPELTDPERVAAARDLAPLCLVVTGVRAKSAGETVAALARAGLANDFLAAHLRGVLNQRLVRLLCSGCRKAAPGGGRALSLLGLRPEEAAGLTPYQATGCEQCRLQAGYRGRTALVELLRPSPQLRGQIAAGAAPDALQQTARAKGMKSLRDRALDKLRAGLIDADEFQRGNF
jgi:type IV pilus assembly protein PilB